MYNQKREGLRPPNKKNNLMKKYFIQKTRIVRVPTDEGESLEEMIRRSTNSKSPIDMTSPMIYTEKKDGVQPQYNIRADRFDYAMVASDKFAASMRAKSNDVEPVDKE